MIQPRETNNSGFTLVELVMVISLMGIIAAMTAPALLEATKNRNRLVIRQTLLTEGQIALERICRELREMDLESGDNDVPDLSAAELSRVDFEQLAYRVSGTELQRSADGGTNWQVMARSVQSFTLSYYDASGTSLSSLPLSEADRESVRRITVEVGLLQNGESLTLRSSAYLRMFSYRS